MNKDIDYYLSLPYTIELIPEDEGGWFVRVKELPGCMSEGNDPADAIEMIHDAMRGWIEATLEMGQPIPEPRELEAFSGNFRLRVPPSLHRSLTEAAADEGVSLNQHINVVLARSIGRRPADRPISALAPAAEPPTFGMLDPEVRQTLVGQGMAAEARHLDEQRFADSVIAFVARITQALGEKRTDDADRLRTELTSVLQCAAKASPLVGALQVACAVRVRTPSRSAQATEARSSRTAAGLRQAAEARPLAATASSGSGAASQLGARPTDEGASYPTNITELWAGERAGRGREADDRRARRAAAREDRA